MNWTHISEHLPTLNQPVLFCCRIDEDEFGDVELGWYEGHKTEGDAIAMETSAGWYPCTHWMALPPTPEVPCDHVEADARLIEAAPMMLESLKRIVQHQDYVGGEFAKMSATRFIAAQAVRNATGEVV
jgi:hypothetical protein